MMAILNQALVTFTTAHLVLMTCQCLATPLPLSDECYLQTLKDMFKDVLPTDEDAWLSEKYAILVVNRAESLRPCPLSFNAETWDYKCEADRNYAAYTRQRNPVSEAETLVMKQLVSFTKTMDGITSVHLYISDIPCLECTNMLARQAQMHSQVNFYIGFSSPLSNPRNNLTRDAMLQHAEKQLSKQANIYFGVLGPVCHDELPNVVPQRIKKSVQCRILSSNCGLSQSTCQPEVPVIHMGETPKYAWSWEEAKAQCESKGLVMATPGILQIAWEAGYDNCYCGWLSNGLAQYPINNPRQGCSNRFPPAIRSCPHRLSAWNVHGWDVYCSTLPVSVVHISAPSGGFTWDEAKGKCTEKGLTLATRAQLQQAWQDGYDKCSCGWLADGSLAYPITKPRQGCEEADPAGLRRCSKNPEEWNLRGWDAYCSTAEVPVIHLRSSAGQYKWTWEEAQQECESRGLTMATRAQLQESWQMGYDNCACGWLADGSAAYPITNPRPACGKNYRHAGLRECTVNPDWGQEGWDVYCSTAEVNVIHENNGVRYSMSFSEARRACRSRGMRIATMADLHAAWQRGYDKCRCGWLADGSVGYPIQNQRKGCEAYPPGVRLCPTDPREWRVKGWDVYCIF